MDQFGTANSTDLTANHKTRSKKPGSCPNCNRRSSKFASFLGKGFSGGKQCPNCQPTLQAAVATPIPTQQSTVPITTLIMVPSSSHNTSGSGEDQQDDSTMISEITMDRALIDTKRPVRTSYESSYQLSTSSSLLTPTPHWMGQGQDFITSMETLTEESEGHYNQRVLRDHYNISKIQEERMLCEQEILTARKASLRQREDTRRKSDDDQYELKQMQQEMSIGTGGMSGVGTMKQGMVKNYDDEYVWERHTHLMQPQQYGYEDDNLLGDMTSEYSADDERKSSLSQRNNSSKIESFDNQNRLVSGSPSSVASSKNSLYEYSIDEDRISQLLQQGINQPSSKKISSRSSSRIQPLSGSATNFSQASSKSEATSLSGGILDHEQIPEPPLTLTFPTSGFEKSHDQKSNSEHVNARSSSLPSTSSGSYNEHSTTTYAIKDVFPYQTGRAFGRAQSPDPSRHQNAMNDQNQTNRTPAKTQFGSIADIPIILRCVSMYPKQKKLIERAFQALFLLATEAEPEGSLARREMISLDGVELLRDSLWQHTNNVNAVCALFHVLWALCFYTSDKETAKIVMDKVQEFQLVELVLRALIRHSEVSKVQEMGYELIKRFDDVIAGTSQLKPAVAVILHNLQSLSTKTQTYIQGMNTLNTLCQHSDDYKLELAKALKGNRAIIEQLKNNNICLESRDLICRLVWCVTSDIKSLSLMAEDQFVAATVIQAMREVPRSESTASFHEAAIGTLANLAMIETNHVKLSQLDAVPIICEEIYVFENSDYVQSAACTALANLSNSVNIQTLAQDEVSALFFSMKSAPDSSAVQCEAMRALNKLCDQVPAAFETGINIIISSFRYHSDVKYIQECACSILSKLSTDAKCRAKLIATWAVFDALKKIQESNPRSESIQHDALNFLRNVACESSIIPIILNRGFVQVIAQAMTSFANCEELQENACHVFWRLASFSPDAKIEICSHGGVNCIVKVS